MDELSSAEFRKQYAHLSRPTRVTVLGRPIGTWLPMVQGTETYASDAITASDARPVHVAPLRTFTPVPKPGKRG